MPQIEHFQEPRLHANADEITQCIITVAVNPGQAAANRTAHKTGYSRGVARIREGLAATGYSGAYVSWDQEYPAGCPPHGTFPYAFKPFGVLEAATLGYRRILWLDCSIVVKAPLEPLFGIIASLGYLFFQNSHSVGEYCKDEALASLKITREESMRMPSCKSGIVGLDLANETSIEFVRQWRDYAMDGVTFPGPKWSGVRGCPRTASSDPRVKGHRHDQGAASVVAARLGMTQWQTEAVLSQYFEIDRRHVTSADAMTPSSLLATRK